MSSFVLLYLSVLHSSLTLFSNKCNNGSTISRRSALINVLRIAFLPSPISVSNSTPMLKYWQMISHWQWMLFLTCFHRFVKISFGFFFESMNGFLRPSTIHCQRSHTNTVTYSLHHWEQTGADFRFFLDLPPAEVFSFAFHTALTEIAATTSDASTRKQVKRKLSMREENVDF